MSGIAARLGERTPGRRVPSQTGGGLVRYTPHCVRVTVPGCGAGEPVSHTGKQVHQVGAELRRSGAHGLAVRVGAGGAPSWLATVRMPRSFATSC